MKMVKQSILLVIFSTIAIFIRNQLAYALHALVYIHNKVAAGLGFVFSNDPTGQVIQGILALIIIPLLGGLLVGLGYWLVKRVEMPHLMATIWAVWTVMLVTLLSQIA